MAELLLALVIGSLVFALVTVFLLRQILGDAQKLSNLVIEILRVVQLPPDYQIILNAMRDSKSDTVRSDALRDTNSEIARELSVQDRLQLARLVALMNRLDIKVDEAATQAGGVAEDLQAAHERADAAEGPHGAAADAALRTQQSP